VLIVFAAIWGSAFVARAEQPPIAPAAAEAKAAPPPRTKPQVIYHLPRRSTYAATLHSQAKGQSNVLPIDSSMPTSLQISRAKANEEAARAQEPSASPTESAASAESSRERTLKRVKIQSNRPHFRSDAIPKVRGPGNPHRNKSHKK
jgi:hypothetical protein